MARFGELRSFVSDCHQGRFLWRFHSPWLRGGDPKKRKTTTTWIQRDDDDDDVDSMKIPPTTTDSYADFDGGDANLRTQTSRHHLQTFGKTKFVKDPSTMCNSTKTRVLAFIYTTNLSFPGSFVDTTLSIVFAT